MAGAVSLYPEFGIEKLRSQHGRRWADLIDWIKTLPLSDPHSMALTLTLRRVQRSAQLHTSGRNSAPCSDPFCAVCAAEALTGFHGSEQDLLNIYEAHLNEITGALKGLRHARRPRVGRAHVA